MSKKEFKAARAAMTYPSISYRIAHELEEKLEDQEVVRTTLRNLFYVGIFLLSVAFLVDASYNPFLYFRF